MKRFEIWSCNECPFAPDPDRGWGHCLYPGFGRAEGPDVEHRPDIDKRAPGCPLETETVEVVPA
jgi:hypothetical protein